MLALTGVAEGASAAGLSRDSALPLCRQALMGTALMLGDHDESPAALKDRVASPGGTTIAGLAVLEEEGVRGTLLRSVERSILDKPEGRS